MDFSFDGNTFDPSKCSKLSIDEKREFVYQVSKSVGATEILQTWSRQDILQILCIEMGKERKYTGLTKLKIIEHLLKLIAEKKPEIPTDTEKSLKRQRKTETPSRITMPISCNNNGVNDTVNSNNTVCCKNSACRANLKQDDVFCKRCSCCICYKYDDNKDPSVWLTCGSEAPFEGVACGMSCHLDCALKHENSGIGRDGFDGSFRCIACWKVNDLLGCWKKQLMIAKETRRVDILCFRLSLSQKLLNPSGKYRKPYDIIDGAVKQLQEEVGPLTGLPVKMGRGIVNRLSCGPEIQKRCTFALDSLDKIASTLAPPQFLNPVMRDINAAASSMVRFEDISVNSLTVVLGSEDHSPNTVVGYKLWHCSSQDLDYPIEPTCTLFLPSRRFAVRGLSPNTEYHFKVVSFSDGRRETDICEARCRTRAEALDPRAEGPSQSQSPVTNCSSLSNPSSVEDEEHHPLQIVTFVPDPDENKLEFEDRPGGPAHIGLENPGNSKADLPITPCKMEIAKDAQGGRRSISKSSAKEALNDGNSKEEGPTSKKRDRESGRDFEYYVKVIRWLECEGHIERNFRQKFLTWFSLRAGPQEVRVVKAFVDTFIQDPASLAEQLVDTFSECVSSRKLPVVPSGFCMKLWH